MTVVTRFPPSPTGFLHIGGARTALFNWLFAKRHGGTFLLRIEDTDRKRHSEEAVDAIIKGLEWLELDYDGDVVSQFENQKRHQDVAQELLDKGMAYHCYCSPEELEEMRETARKEGKSTFYDRRWRDREPSEAPAGIDPVVRIKAPLEGESVIDDKVQSEIHLQNTQLDDFIILRSDGTPTYMLSVVVDDHDMAVTHVIRGDDHINNAFRQKIIFEAMGWDVPVFAHVPLIHGPDGKKLSKRHGAASVEEYREMGYLPEAMRNYLLRLGWSHGDDEIIPTQKAIEWFNLDSIGKSAANFDFAKLENLNSHYIEQADGERLINLCAEFYKDRHDVVLNDDQKSQVLAIQDELKSRAKTLLQFTDESAFFGFSTPFNFDEKAESALYDAGTNVLEAIRDSIANLDDFSTENVQGLCKNTAAIHADGKMGKIAMPLRAALTGTTVSPSVFHVAEILGKKACLERLEAAIVFLANNPHKASASN